MAVFLVWAPPVLQCGTQWTQQLSEGTKPASGVAQAGGGGELLAMLGSVPASHGVP